MEKQRHTERKRFICGLLSGFFLFCTFLFSAFPLNAAPMMTPAEISELKIRPAPNEELITNRIIKFELEIPTIPPENVEITSPISSDEIIFKSLRRTSLPATTPDDQEATVNIAHANSNGTKIELWYEFLIPGEIKPESLKIKILNHTFLIAFDYILIEENPKNLSPKMVFKFSNGKSLSVTKSNSGTNSLHFAIFSTSAATPLKISVFVQYTNDITAFNVELPKNAFFQNLENYEILKKMADGNNSNGTKGTANSAKSTDQNFSHDLIPVADFEWTPLSKGKTQLPEIALTAISYGGDKVELTTPNVFVNVTSKKTEKRAENIKAFESQFDETISETYSAESMPIIDVFGEIAQQRGFYQKIIVASLSALSFFLFVAILLSAKVRKSQIAKKIFFTSIFLAALSMTALMVSAIKSKQSIAIFTGGQVNSIPEFSVGNHIKIAENTKVKIVKKTEDWYCIQSNGNIGWTLKENIVWK